MEEKYVPEECKKNSCYKNITKMKINDENVVNIQIPQTEVYLSCGINKLKRENIFSSDLIQDSINKKLMDKINEIIDYLDGKCNHDYNR